MADKVYEYKDDQNWFIGQWGDYEYVSSFLEDNLWSSSKQLFEQLGAGTEEGPYFQIHIVRYQSKERFIRFLVDMVNDKQGRQLAVYIRQGAVLLEEAGRIIYIDMPEMGVSATEFFGQEIQSPLDLGDTILIATKNEGKTKEFRAFFAELGYQVENLNTYPDLPDVEETGMTFEENARLKAETIAKLTGKMVLADDSGLKVDKLGGLPGIWSARFGGPDTTDARNNAKLLHELSVVHEQRDRSAQFHCTLVMAAPGYDSLVVEAEWHGYIATVPRGENGFGYDPLFLVGETGQTAAEMDIEEKNKQSHRAKALEKLLEAFPVWQQEQRLNSL